MHVCQSAIKTNQYSDYYQVKKKFQNELLDAEVLVIFGFSMGYSDSQYFENLLGPLNKLNKIMVIDYDRSALKMVKMNMNDISKGKLMSKIESGKIEYGEYTTNDYYSKESGAIDEKEKYRFSELIRHFVTYPIDGMDIDI